MSADVTRIELAKALKSIKAVATHAQFEETKKLYIQEGGEDSIMSAVNGLSEEDEFSMLTKLLGTTTHIIGLEQRPLIDGHFGKNSSPFRGKEAVLIFRSAFFTTCFWE
ncbi:hypothetical protein ACL9RF_17500 [Sphingobacterium sp. Mn56C]|uniref:hypothetical protein n=1 Tax=Sphingobacterium sp. Mn56C TaxID=3395261 RepID=UPI003BDB7A54